MAGNEETTLTDVYIAHHFAIETGQREGKQEAAVKITGSRLSGPLTLFPLLTRGGGGTPIIFG